MLFVHPSSQCDVCLDAYTWSTPAKAPHAIQCGHIFCLYCLRTVNPSNCPMCRKAFNPERIKKLHVDKAPADGTALMGAVSEENELLRRVGSLFGEDSEDEDVNALVEEVTAWLSRHTGSTHHALRNAITALHQYKALQAQKTIDAETIEKLRATHERHAHVKQKDLDIAMAVERNMLNEQEKLRTEYKAKVGQAEAEIAALRGENARIQTELDRYTAPSNPLPRPPEIIPLVTSITRDHAASAARPSQAGISSLGLGTPPAQAAPSQPATSASQSRSSSGSSGSSRTRGASVHFVGDPLPHESRHRPVSDHLEPRQEKVRRSHLVVPGAPPSRKVVPPRLEGDESTPRGPMSNVPNTPQIVPLGSTIVWPPHLQQYAPKPGSPCVWVGPPDEPHEILPNEVPLSSIIGRQAIPPNGPQAGSSTVPPPVIPPLPSSMAMTPTPTAGPRPPADTGSIRRVSPPNAPMSGRSPMDWRPGPAHKEGYVAAFVPEIGISWIPEAEAAKLPVRARGTESRYSYVIAKEPDEVDDEWRQIHNGASPGPNPLQLTGVPEVPVAGPSTSTIRRVGQYEPLSSSVAAVSTLFRNPPGASDRTITTNSSNASINGIGLLVAPTAAGARTAVSQTSSSGVQDDLGLNLTSLPEPRDIPRAPAMSAIGPEPSPASTWGTLPTPSTRNSSLNNLNIQNLPEPPPFPRPFDSLDQLPIGELNGGPIVLTDTNTPRHSQHSLLRSDDASVSHRSERSRGRDMELSGLGLNPSAGSSHQVVTSLRDLEEVNRSLLQLSHAPEAERSSERSSHREASRSSRPSTHHHSRQLSVSGDDNGGAIIGARTGIVLYGPGPAVNHTGARVSNGPSPDGPSPPAHSRPRSGASMRSHAESTSSSYSHHSIHSSYSAHSAQSAHSVPSADSYHSARHRSRRGSTAVFAQSQSPYDHSSQDISPPWTTTPADMHPYASASRGGPYAQQAPPPAPAQSQKSLAESVPRSIEGLSSVPGSLSSLLLNFGPENNTSVVTATGEEATGIHAPRPVNGRRASLFGSAWNARNGR